MKIVFAPAVCRCWTGHGFLLFYAHACIATDIFPLYLYAAVVVMVLMKMYMYWRGHRVPLLSFSIKCSAEHPVDCMCVLHSLNFHGRHYGFHMDSECVLVHCMFTNFECVCEYVCICVREKRNHGKNRYCSALVILAQKVTWHCNISIFPHQSMFYVYVVWFCLFFPYGSTNGKEKKNNVIWSWKFQRFKWSSDT